MARHDDTNTNCEKVEPCASSSEVPDSSASKRKNDQEAVEQASKRPRNGETDAPEAAPVDEVGSPTIQQPAASAGPASAELRGCVPDAGRPWASARVGLRPFVHVRERVRMPLFY